MTFQPRLDLCGPQDGGAPVAVPREIRALAVIHYIVAKGGADVLCPDLVQHRSRAGRSVAQTLRSAWRQTIARTLAWVAVNFYSQVTQMWHLRRNGQVVPHTPLPLFVPAYVNEGGSDGAA
jgi:hypothetical protein